MLHLGNQDAITRPQHIAGPGRGHEIDRLGRSPGKNDRVRRRRIQETGDPFSGSFVKSGRSRAQFVEAPMDIGVVLTIVAAKLVNDALGSLGRGGVIQVNQRAPMYLLIQDRKILPELAGQEVR